MLLVGEAMVQAEMGGIKRKVKLFVAKGNCLSLFGGDCFMFSMEIAGQEN